MLTKKKILYSATQRDTIENMALEIMRNIPKENNILKIVFFVGATNSENYIYNKETLQSCVNKEFSTNTPLVSYVAQETATGLLTAEVIILEQENVEIERHSNYILLTSNDTRELMTGGIIPDNLHDTIFAQARNIFDKIKEILDRNRFATSDIYRQWNYIEGITIESDGSQNYQEFNDARSIFYSDTDWSNGYPAATGIGACAGGVMVDFYAAQSNSATNKPIDNPLQIAAHNYSQQVLGQNKQAELPEKTTPKFERARLTQNTIHISGTAAIRGEKSSDSNNIIAQTQATMQIMDHLISVNNTPTECTATEYDFLRIYVKQRSDIPQVQKYMQQHYPTPLKHYLVSDICRPELLIEIEGTAHIIK